jgi:serine/threonine protein phosphatase 1
LRNGGAQTLRSFGIAPEQLIALGPSDRGRAIVDAIGGATIDWMRALPTRFVSGDYFFCHAGIRPGTALDQQKERDLLWIGEEFIRNTADHGAVIVHGHTEAREPEIHSNRINVDTGAYRTGRLSAIGLEGTARWALQVEIPAVRRHECRQTVPG